MNLSRTFAKALDQATQNYHLSENEKQEWEKVLIQWGEVFKDPEILSAMRSPLMTLQEKVTCFLSIDDSIGLHPCLSSFLNQVIQHNQLENFSEIILLFQESCLKRSGGVMGEIISATSLEAELLQKVERILSEKFKQKIVLRTKIDVGLIAGIKIILNGMTYDGTLRSSLRGLKKRLVQRVIEGIEGE